MGSNNKEISQIVEQTMLFDFYGELLTEHQKNIYEDVVLNDMSLTEIAESYGISRQAVSDLMKRINRILNGYESKLHLVEKFERAKDKVKEIRSEAETLRAECRTSFQGHQKAEELDQKLKKIQKISDSILEEY